MATGVHYTEGMEEPETLIQKLEVAHSCIRSQYIMCGNEPSDSELPSNTHAFLLVCMFGRGTCMSQ